MCEHVLFYMFVALGALYFLSLASGPNHLAHSDCCVFAFLHFYGSICACGGPLFMCSLLLAGLDSGRIRGFIDIVGPGILLYFDLMEHIVHCGSGVDNTTVNAVPTGFWLNIRSLELYSFHFIWKLTFGRRVSSLRNG